jgi:hypothetical protein
MKLGIGDAFGDRRHKKIRKNYMSIIICFLPIDFNQLVFYHGVLSKRSEKKGVGKLFVNHKTRIGGPRI